MPSPFIGFQGLKFQVVSQGVLKGLAFQWLQKEPRAGQGGKSAFSWFHFFFLFHYKLFSKFFILIQCVMGYCVGEPGLFTRPLAIGGIAVVRVQGPVGGLKGSHGPVGSTWWSWWSLSLHSWEAVIHRAEIVSAAPALPSVWPLHTRNQNCEVHECTLVLAWASQTTHPVKIKSCKHSIGVFMLGSMPVTRNAEIKCRPYNQPGEKEQT